MSINQNSSDILLIRTRFWYCREHFDAALRLLIRRLDMNDANYTSVQTAKVQLVASVIAPESELLKAINVLNNLLLVGPKRIINHLRSHSRGVSDLKFANPRNVGESPTTIETIKANANQVLELLNDTTELDRRRSFFLSTYNHASPVSRYANFCSFIKSYA